MTTENSTKRLAEQRLIEVNGSFPVLNRADYKDDASYRAALLQQYQELRAYEYRQYCQIETESTYYVSSEYMKATGKKTNNGFWGGYKNMHGKITGYDDSAAMNASNSRMIKNSTFKNNSSAPCCAGTACVNVEGIANRFGYTGSDNIMQPYERFASAAELYRNPSLKGYASDKAEKSISTLLQEGKIGPGSIISIKVKKSTQNSSGYHAMTVVDVKRDARGNIVSYTLQGSNKCNLQTFKIGDSFSSKKVMYLNTQGWANDKIKQESKQLSNLSTEEIEAAINQTKTKVTANISDQAKIEHDICNSPTTPSKCEPYIQGRLCNIKANFRSNIDKSANILLACNESAGYCDINSAGSAYYGVQAPTPKQESTEQPATEVESKVETKVESKVETKVESKAEAKVEDKSTAPKKETAAPQQPAAPKEETAAPQQPATPKKETVAPQQTQYVATASTDTPKAEVTSLSPKQQATMKSWAKRVKLSDAELQQFQSKYGALSYRMMAMAMSRPADVAKATGKKFMNSADTIRNNFLAADYDVSTLARVTKRSPEVVSSLLPQTQPEVNLAQTEDKTPQPKTISPSAREEIHTAFANIDETYWKKMVSTYQCYIKTPKDMRSIADTYSANLDKLIQQVLTTDTKPTKESIQETREKFETYMQQDKTPSLQEFIAYTAATPAQDGNTVNKGLSQEDLKNARSVSLTQLLAMNSKTNG